MAMKTIYLHISLDPEFRRRNLAKNLYIHRDQKPTFRTAVLFSSRFSARSHQLDTQSLQALAMSESLAALLKEPILSSTPARRLAGWQLQGSFRR